MKQEVFDNLLNVYRENKLAHAYLFETKDIEKCYQELLIFIKKMLCKSDYHVNCQNCEICHLIEEGNIPSIITIEPDGKNIKTDSINNLKKIFSMKPSYIPYNIYIIKYPEKMNATSFNKMLKFLEEPEEDILGFYITYNKDMVASTIVSRCELIKIKESTYDKQGNLTDEEYALCQRLAQEYYEKLENKQKNITWYNTTVLLKELTSQEQFVCFFNLIYNIYELKFQNTKEKILLKKLKLIENYLNKLNYNMNLSLLLDSFVIEMGEINEL